MISKTAATTPSHLFPETRATQPKAKNAVAIWSRKNQARDRVEPENVVTQVQILDRKFTIKDALGEQGCGSLVREVEAAAEIETEVKQRTDRDEQRGQCIP
jgi:hypothetical protein